MKGRHQAIQKKLIELYTELFLHEGYGSLRVEMRFLKRGQKEIILVCGKEFRYVVDYPDPSATGIPGTRTEDRSAALEAPAMKTQPKGGDTQSD